jgi:hypothetical protein
MTMATGVPGFRIRVPPSWFQFDAWRASRTADLARLVDARITHEPQLGQYRGALLGLLREFAEDAQRRGALLCAVTADPVANAGNLLASLMVFRTEGSADPKQNTVEGIAAGITAHEGGEGNGSWRRVHVIELPAGRAVRVSGVDVVHEGTAELDAVVMHTLWPVPAPGGGVFDVVLTSPQTQLADAMLDLFDAISGTFTWVENEAEGLDVPPESVPDPGASVGTEAPQDPAANGVPRPTGPAERS